jgi:hypothetical protein
MREAEYTWYLLMFQKHLLKRLVPSVNDKVKISHHDRHKEPISDERVLLKTPQHCARMHPLIHIRLIKFTLNRSIWAQYFGVRASGSSPKRPRNSKNELLAIFDAYS